ncbi:LIM and calponin homology domains-containing protein 1-like isoform X7 [Argiope bruennichi]|uniref:LIM and calponin homology domains-containing protein 1-like isoform X7 n=1 Tax=Argiope bruennichi TaxID=94029 RepID=UPI002493EC6E|nr:LIM and calponin homology domains-containing protein 1-like isoform X7 [Argiope bruennichi]
MPGTTRYSATFDRPYEEEERPASDPSNGSRRSRSQSWQANIGGGVRSYSSLGHNKTPPQRSSSTDSGTSSGTEHIPTRTVSKTVVKTHNNPFQFVKVGSCPLYKKAEEQLKKVKEVKKPDVLKEEEEEWQSNLDSWKSRRRKMSEDVFRRQEEIRQFEQEEQNCQVNQKKIKTFSEMVESRANRGRTLSLCLISSPLELQEWENQTNKSNSSHPFSEGSAENSAVNSEDEGVAEKRTFQKNLWSNGNNGSSLKNDSSNGCKSKMNETSYADSGLESISSSHRMGDTPDSCSDFSQDSGSSIDCDSPRVSGLLLNGVNILEDFNSKCISKSDCEDSNSNSKTDPDTIFEKERSLESVPVLNEKTECSAKEIQPVTESDFNSNCVDVSTATKPSESSADSSAPKSLSNDESENNKIERSIESENEVFVDDFEELDTQSKVFCSNRATAKIVSMEITNDKNNFPENQKETAISSPQINEESLNIVFQSQSLKSKDFSNNVKTSNITEKVVLNDVPPVEKIAEQMEKLILQQLEEEERAKELSSKLPTSDLFGSPEHNLIAPPKLVEPPKEKPPPPPVVEIEAPKAIPLKRVNSTKRIKKEIHKRMSNFLGIEAADNGICDENSVPPPPALEQILKVEVELEKENRKRVEIAADERLRLEETKIIEKEQEIIANLETEERQRELLNNAEICDFMQDEDRIQKLKKERKKMESEKLLAETQKLRQEEEKQLREREKFIRLQEANNASSAEISASVLSDAEKFSNNASNASSLCLDTKHNVSFSSFGGEGKTISNSSSQPVDFKTEKLVPDKPEVPPKPLKKKEAIRKERDRLRQEQEALQKEREEHRLKLLKEQDEILKNHPKPYAPNAPATRLGPIPPLKPSYNPQLTNRIGPQPSTRENVVYTSQNYPSAQNGISGNSGCVEPVLNKQSKPISSHKKAVQNDAWAQQKVSPIKKQSLESSPESKYNQNHWLIQEAEMRRIAELKERQLSVLHPIPQTHLAEDDVCSTLPRAPPAILMNPPLQERMWSYGHSNRPVKKYTPPVNAEKPVGQYPMPPQPPAKPSRVVPMERPEHMLSVSGRKRCSHCSEELGRGAAMIIESLQLYYHIHCFQCCVCQAQLGNGSCGTDVRVRNNKLHCHNCYSNDEAGLKFSQLDNCFLSNGTVDYTVQLSDFLNIV